MSEGTRSKSSHINTVLLTIVLAVVGYVAATSMETAKSVARLDAQNSARVTSTDRMERKLDELSNQVNNQRDTITELRAEISGIKSKLVLTR